MATRFTAWGMSGTVATESPEREVEALEVCRRLISEFDAAVNRFAPEAEISIVNHNPGVRHSISPLFLAALRAADHSFATSRGLCDPTILPALAAAGYDRDFAEISELATSAEALPAIGFPLIDIDYEASTVTLPVGGGLDLGSSAKALFVDLLVERLAHDGACLVELGGDVAARGVGPDGPWVVGVTVADEITGHEPKVFLGDGAICTSSTTLRSWRTNTGPRHHIIDPRTGESASSSYTRASVAAASCVDANCFATALLVDDDIAFDLVQAGWGARLTTRWGTVEYVGSWPKD